MVKPLSITQEGEKRIRGTVFYASKDAQKERLYKEGGTINTESYHRAVYLEDNFVQLDLDESGTNYVHVTIGETK